MSNIAVKGIVAAALALAASAGFSAQEARTLAVSATIAGGCTLVTSGPMAFGNLNMTGTGDEVKQVTVTYKCATGITVSSFSVGGDVDGSFAGTMSALTTGLTDTVPYSIAWTPPGPYAGQGFGPAVGQNVVLTGTIANADYITKATGSYAQNVTLAINF